MTTLSPGPAAEPTSAQPSRPPGRRGGGENPLRDRPAVAWLAAAILTLALHPVFPWLTWLTVHLVLLGALTHSILVWSAHFAQALLKTARSPRREHQQNTRIAGHIVGTLLVLAGSSTATWPMTIVGATLVSGVVVWHGISLWSQLRRALPGRFRITIRYYLVAAAALPVGALFGVLLARGLDDEVQGRYLVAHTLTMLLGWVGLTVCGTLLTLWPTMLRTRLDPRAELAAARALPILVAAIGVVDGGALLGRAASPIDGRWIIVTGIACYAIGLGWWSRALWRPARTAPPRHAATWSVAAALVWFAIFLATVAVQVASTPSWRELAAGYDRPALIVTAGFAAQLLIGALSHLIPVVLGGGSAVWRTAQAVLDRYAVARVLATNLGLAVWVWAPGAAVRTAAAVVTVCALSCFLPLMMSAIHAAIRTKRERSALPAAERGPIPDEHGIWSPGQAVAAAAAVVLALSVGVAWDPGAVGLTGGASGASSAAVTASGHTTTVAVTAQGMTFSPARIEVPAGDRLVIELTNADQTTPHDLVLDNGADSGRIDPGASTTLDAGVIGGNLDGWCSVVGHRQMGMTLQVITTGSTAAAAQANSHAGSADTAAATPVRADATVPAAFRAADPRLPEIATGTTHHVTLTVQDRELEVAPGVRQRRWTFNGTAPGPTLHGRLGDTFVITLVNDAPMGHSIDFHAGTLAPDRPMRTIAPGQRLTYTFTATRAGIWMYHCSTMPMSAHIAAGLFGAVVIDPPDLTPVAASYVLTQSETYLSGDGRSTVAEVNASAAMGGEPSFQSFNGLANQYDHRPIRVRAGQRIRFWLLDAGPNRATAFHVVGGQFDTTYAEGAYLLKQGRDAFGGTGGGAQVLALQPAQGGFVEITFPEPGHYPFTSHVMADAERGAHGIIEVTR